MSLIVKFAEDESVATPDSIVSIRDEDVVDPSNAGGKLLRPVAEMADMTVVPMSLASGAEANDTLVGTNGSDELRGLGGDDSLEGRGGADILDGGAGEDTATYVNATVGLEVFLIAGGPSTGEAAGDTFFSIENLIGSKFNDSLFGDFGNNKLYGGDGNDTLYGWGGNDWLYGGEGVDNVVGGSGIDHMFGEGGIDTLSYQLSTSGITISLLDPTINKGDAAGDVYSGFEDVTGTNYDDVIYGDGQAVNNLWGLAGNDKIYGGDGYDVMIGDASADYLDGGAGRDEADYETSPIGVTISLADPSLNTGHGVGDVYVNIEDLAGSRFDDTLYGDAQDNNFLGWPGNDSIFGAAGDDALEGGPGADRLDGGTGIDTASYSSAGTAPGFDPSFTVLGVGVTASLLDPSINKGEAAGDTYFSIENLQGSSFADILHGDNSNNVIIAAGGNDSVYGEAGDDLLLGGEGADRVDGGAGFDYAGYDRATAGVIASLANPATNTGEATGDTYFNIEGLSGSTFGDVLIGDNLENRLMGGAGNDSLFGGGGNDFLYGGTGGDQMDGGTGYDTISYATSGASVTASLQNTALNAGEASGDTYGNIEALEGSNFADKLFGYDYAPTSLFGGAGDDELTGGAADDILVGGAGADKLSGGAGVDIASYITSSSGVVADMMTAQGTSGDAAGDTFFGIETLAGTNFGDILSGDNNANTIIGADGNDYLFGRGGNDGLEGGAGGDYLSGGDGVDTVLYANAIAGVTANLLNPQFNTGDAAGDTYDGIENMIGSSFNDVLGGSDGQNTILAGVGDDKLYGAGGDDLLEGGAGGDLLDGGAGYDFASYTQAGASVTVFLAGAFLNTGDAAGDSYNSIEGILGSPFADFLGGDNGSNTIQGYGGNDWLLGGGGDDYLLGGDGFDLLEGGLGHDMLDGGAGIDLASYRNATTGLAANLLNPSGNTGEAAGDAYVGIENIWGTDFGDIIGGNDGNGQVYGFDGNDYLLGYGGDDNLYGGAGKDTLLGGTGADTFFFLQKSEGGDQIKDFTSGSDRIFFSQYFFGLAISPPGAIDGSQFVSGAGAVAHDANDQFIYDTTSGILYFDEDGSGAGAAIVMATLGPGVTLTAQDIWSA